MPVNEDLGKLILRLTVGILLLFHGVAKITGGVGFIGGMLGNYGLPGFIAYLVYVGEVIAPLFLVAGFYTRIAAVLTAGNMVVAILLAHMGDLFSVSGTGGYTLELQMFFLLGSVTIFFMGAGKYSVGGKAGAWN